MTLLVGYMIFLGGVLIGAILRHEEDCPRRVLGYSCKDDCDHRKSVLYTNMARMAKGAEEDELEKERNLWKGDKDA